MSGPITKSSARAILLDGKDLVLFKRTRTGQTPYWTTIGGGVEPEDPDVEAALHREVFEEIGGTVHSAQLVHLLTERIPGGLKVQYVFAARLASMNPGRRTGDEFDQPERGEYELVRLPFTAEGVGGIDLMPTSLRGFIAANIEAIRSVLDHPVHVPRAPLTTLRRFRHC